MRVCLGGRLGKICPAKIGAAKIDTIDPGVSEIHAVEICPAQNCLLEPGSEEAGPAKISADKIGSLQEGSL